MKRFALPLSAFMLLAFACGGRNLEAGPGPDDDDDGSAGGGGGLSAGGMGGVGGEGFGGDAGFGGEGAQGGGQPPNPIDCLQCVGQSCPAAVQCFTNPECLQGLVCAVGQCLGGGQPDFMCISECFNGDLGAAQEAITAIVCISTSCSDECGNFLPFAQ